MLKICIFHAILNVYNNKKLKIFYKIKAVDTRCDTRCEYKKAYYNEIYTKMEIKKTKNKN